MNKFKLIFKYSIFMLVLVIIERFVQPYAMKMYFSFNNNPDLMPDTIQQFQSIVMTFNFLLNLVITIFMIIDSKNKKGIDWILFIITFFSAEIGIPLFLIWQIYKEMMIKYEAQQKIQCMPQLVDRIKVNILNKDYRKLKNYRFKMRHAPYLNRCVQSKDETK